MRVYLNGDEGLLVENASGRNFVRVEGSIGETSLGVVIYSQFKLQMRFKKGFYKMFSFESQKHFEIFDFGFWSDAEIIWES